MAEPAERSMEAMFQVYSLAVQLLSSSHDYHRTMQTLLKLIVPALGDYVFIRLLDKRGETERIHISCKITEKEMVLREILARHTWNNRLGQTSGARATKTGKPVLVKRIDDQYFREVSTTEQQYKLLKRLGTVSTIAVPLILEGIPIGSISFGSLTSDRIYDERDVSFFKELGRLAVIAIDRSIAYQKSLEAAQFKKEIKKITKQGIERQYNSIDREIGRLLSVVSRIEDPALRKIISSSAKQVQRGIEEIDSRFEELNDATRFWEERDVGEKAPQQLGALIEIAIRNYLPAANKRSIRIETQFDSAIPSVLCDPDVMSRMLEEWLSLLLPIVPEKSSILLKLEEKAGEVVLTTVKSKTGRNSPEFTHIKGTIELLGGQVLEKNPGKTTKIWVFAFPGFILS